MSTPLSPLLAPMLSSAAMRAVCDDATTLQNMLDFEAALARAEAAAGVIPESAVGPITNAGKADAEAARYVHWGATSQDVIDTGAMLGLRAGTDALLADIDRAISGFAA